MGHINSRNTNFQHQNITRTKWTHKWRPKIEETLGSEVRGTLRDELLGTKA